MENKIIEKLIGLNKRALQNGDVPVSCIITKDDKILSYAYNMKVKLNDPFAHAEILAIKKACKKINSYNLSDCTLYTSLYPCNMCLELIKESRIKKVKYILDKEKEINSKIECEKLFVKNEYFKEELSNFFVDKR